jgi:AraC family transcriptional regulator of adaptative response/methylated-DNA-[protein]-cysteine methyltransferase
MKDKSTNYYRIEKAIRYIEENFKRQPDLDEIAAEVNLSPFHFQCLFVDWVGLTPKKFLQFLTMNYLKTQIHSSRNVIEAADSAGLSSQSRVYDLFINVEGMSPQQFKTAGLGMEIFYGYHATPFGMCFIAIAERGICELHFVDKDLQRTEYRQFQQKWCLAKLTHQPDYTQEYIQRIFKPEPCQDKIHLLVQGTSFQIKVWEALVNIPFGQVNSYEQLASRVGHPGNIRAVASAAGRNPVSYLIPCHRVITKEGDVGNFNWGRIRKRTMIAWEMAQIAV